MSSMYSFFVPDIRCVNCHNPIKDALMADSSLQIDSVEIDDKEVSIHVPEGVDEFWLQQKITAVLKAVGHSPVFSDELFQEQSSEQTAQHWLQGIVGCVSGLSLMMLCLAVGPMSLGFMIPLTLASGVLTLILGKSSYERAFKEWANGTQLSMDSLFTVSTFIVLIMSVVSLFVPGLPMMLDTGLLIFGFRHLGLAIESLLTQGMQINARFSDRLPRTVQVASADETEVHETPLHAVNIGDILMIQPGEIIPLDGHCLNGGHEIYDDIITGSYLPRKIQINEKLLSGMRLSEESEALKLKVIQPLETSHLKRRDELNAKIRFENKASLEVMAKTLVNYFIPVVMGLAVLSGGVLACFLPWTIAIRCAIAVLVSACPCTLGLIVPLAVKIGMKKASDSGVQFQSKEQLQRAGEVDCVVFDLNGTLTCGIPEVHGELVWDETQISKEECFRAISILEKDSKHPHGRAIYQYVRHKTSSALGADVRAHRTGVSAHIGEHEYLIGNKQMLEEHDIDIEAYYQQNHLELKSSSRIIYLVRSRHVVAHLELRDPLRRDARPMIDALRTMGKTIFICTGDELETTKGYAEQLGIPAENIRARQRCSLNESGLDDKSSFIQELTDKGHRVAMVGDAGNDVNAISASYFGLALRSAGSDEVTAARAGAVILGSSLLPVLSTFAISQQTVSQIKQNLWLSLGYNVVTEILMGGFLAVLGVVLNPGIGAALMIIQMGLIFGNAYRFQQEPIVGPALMPQGIHGVRENALSESVSDDLSSFHSASPGRDVVSSVWASPKQLNASPILQHSQHFLSHEALLPEQLPSSPQSGF